MNYIIISDNKTFIKNIQKTLSNFDSNLVIYDSDFKAVNLEKLKNNISSTSLTIVYSKKTAVNSQVQLLLANFTGYLIANEIPVVTNLSFINNTIFTNTGITFFETEELIKQYLQSSLLQLQLNDNKRLAKKALFDQGIPFSPECFAFYINKNKTKIIDQFIQAGIDINSTDENDTPMINLAVRNNNFELTKRFLELGVDVNVTSKDRGYTPIMDAVFMGNKNICRLLINYNADLNTINKEGQTNLILAVGADKKEISAMLAANGADPDIKDQMGMSAYDYARLFKKTEILSVLEPYHKA